MNTQHGPLARVVNRLLDTDGAPGDERERAVVAQAASFGIVLGTCASLVVALVGALLGALALPAAVLVLMTVSAMSAIWFAGRHGVDMYVLAAQVDGRARTVTLAVHTGGMLLIVAAMAYTVFTGHGLLELPSVDLTGPDASGGAASFVRGAVIGAFASLVVALVAILVQARVRARRAGDTPPAEYVNSTWPPLGRSFPARRRERRRGAMTSCEASGGALPEGRPRCRGRHEPGPRCPHVILHRAVVWTRTRLSSRRPG